MSNLNIDKKSTALVVIDLQKGVVYGNNERGPYTTETVVSNASKLVQACRKNGIIIFLVHVQPTPQTALNPDADTTPQARPRGDDYAEFIPEMTPQHGDVIITKHQWGAFYGTDLELRLRRAKIDTIILCGISTNIGVESTARFAFEHGYKQIFVEDAMTAKTAAEHDNSIHNIFKRIGKVRTAKEVLEQLD